MGWDVIDVMGCNAICVCDVMGCPSSPQALGTLFPFLDLTRVGIYGWSFGGYFSAHAVMQRPDVFRAGVAGAPVRMSDTM